MNNGENNPYEPSFPLRVEKQGQVLIQWDHKGSKYLYSQPRFYGKPLGARKIRPEGIELPFTYSFFEACYLLSNSIIEVFEENKKIDFDYLMDFCKHNYENFHDNFLIYQHFRSLNYVVRPGMKFGSEFIVYSTGPGIDHAEYVIHILHDHEKIRTFDLVKAGRLAGTVKKIFLLAYISKEGSPEFLQLDRVKI